jgi:excinuclease UvrABC nuclease subunit
MDVAKHFDTVAHMVEADVGEWVKIPGIGKTTAARVVDALHKL